MIEKIHKRNKRSVDELFGLQVATIPESINMRYFLNTNDLVCVDFFKDKIRRRDSKFTDCSDWIQVALKYNCCITDKDGRYYAYKS